MTDWQKKKVREIAAHYGIDSQSKKAAEECAELIVAIMHMEKKVASASEALEFCTNLAGEIADVRIMCEQLAYLYGIGEVVKEKIDFKISRQLDRMEKGE